jgi:GAF domain-containing protein
VKASGQDLEIGGKKHLLRRIRRQLQQESAFVHLLRVVTAAANETAPMNEALQTTLDAVCALTGWPVGHALLRVDDKDELVSTGLWHLEGAKRFESFRSTSEALTFGGGVGLPGRVLAGGVPVWVPDVTKDTNFPRNRMVQDHGLKAAFAFPILVGREVAGVLEFFATEKVEPDESVLMVMHQVGAQLGRVVERSRAEQTLSSLAKGIAQNQGEDLLASLAEHLAKSVKADSALIGELKEGRDAVRTLAVSVNGAAVANFDYDLAGTPCETVVNKKFCSFARGVQQKFPKDRMLADMKVESYAGTPLFGSTGEVLGLIVALWSRPPANMRVAESMIQIFAVRAAAEVERRRAERTVEKLAEVPRANPHPVLEFSGDGTLRFCNPAAYVLARSMGKEDPIHILPADTAGVVKRCIETGKNGVVIGTIGEGRTVIWSFIPIVKNDSVFAHAFELTLFLDLHDEMRRMGMVPERTHGTQPPSIHVRSRRRRTVKEVIH